MNRGERHSKAARRRIGAANRGRKHSAATRRRMKEAALRRWARVRSMDRRLAEYERRPTEFA